MIQIEQLVWHTPGPWKLDMASRTIVADQPEWSSDQSDICFLNDEAGDRDGFPDSDAVACNARLIAAAPGLLREVADLRPARDVLLRILAHWSKMQGLRPASGSQDGLMEYRQFQTDHVHLMLAMCKRYGVEVSA